MESLIGTVRNVGYRFTVSDTPDSLSQREDSPTSRPASA
jgi:DNA-binding winged helix-turn-helix (wHTH) protein